MRPKAWSYGRSPRNKGALQVKRMLDGRADARAEEHLIFSPLMCIIVAVHTHGGY
jgi:hypothetical protein